MTNVQDTRANDMFLSVLPIYWKTKGFPQLDINDGKGCAAYWMI